MNLPLVNIIIPTYNYAHKVTRAIESVMKQTLTNFTCTIVDDDSTDDTAKVVTDFIKNDSRFYYVKQKNAGVAVARNHGISLGNAPYVCCLDADDAIEPLFLEACVKGLEEDKDVAIAYTGLRWIMPSGKEGVGAWPGVYNFDNQLKGKNQIPTCCVFRRVAWERVGGYRKRYCPHGAGSEDAEFWLRLGAYGFKGKKVTDAPLFVYSFLSGMVSGNKSYREIDWRSLHPWTDGGMQPFASVATPYRKSHAVHQYDTPTVSVIIPVGKKHTSFVFDALDSLEGQSFRDWEAIIVNDSDTNEQEWDFDGFPNAMRAYPYVRMLRTTGNKGAGYARNRGAEIARAPLLLFLDADDVLDSSALEDMVIAWGLEKKIIYSNYAGKAFLDEPDLEKFPKKDRLFYDPQTRMAIIRHYSAEFDCEQAVREPTKRMYIWNLISSLVPKEWHNEIGGFDESMIAWEDWDYWIRMARAGKCFYKIDKDLVVYRFYTGTRREHGLQEHKSLIKYMRDKYDEEHVAMCGCTGNATRNAQLAALNASMAARQSADISRRDNSNMAQLADKDVVLCVYAHPNMGQHKVVGASTRTNYGYRKGGDKFYVKRADIAAQPNLFRVFEETIPTPEAPVQGVPKEEPKPIVSTIPIETEEVKAEEVKEEEEPAPPMNIFDRPISDLQGVPGVTPGIRAQLNANNVHNVKELLDFGEEKLVELKGVGDKRAATIIEFAKQYLEKHAE